MDPETKSPGISGLKGGTQKKTLQRISQRVIFIVISVEM